MQNSVYTFRSRFIKVSVALAAVLLWVGCASAPTKVVEDAVVLENPTGTGIPESSLDGKPVTKETILLDARPAFVAAVSPVKQAITLDWRDFTRRLQPRPNSLDGDLFFHTRRLARMGISPESRVVVLGRGPDGDGEEGRLAWTLRYLGISQVEYQSAEDFRSQLQAAQAPTPKEAPMWKPVPNELLLETRAEFLSRIKHSEKFYLLEITTKDRVVQWPQSMQFAAAQRLNFSQDDFFRMYMSNPTALRGLLTSASNDPSTEALSIVVVDPHGEIAAFVTLVLRDLGLQASCACSGATDIFIAPGDIK